MNPVAASSAISPLSNPSIGQASQSLFTPKTEGAKGFSHLVKQFVKDTNQAQVSSDVAIGDLISGKTDNVQQVVMAVANADMKFRLFMEIRNNLVDSYNELMRMQF